MDRPAEVSNRRTRREFLGGVAGAALGLGTAGCVSGDREQRIGSDTYGDWFENVENFDGTDDWTDQDAILIAVGAAGGLAFDPAAVRIEPGTTIIWEWSGRGGSHSVVEENGVFESKLYSESGKRFEYTFQEPGVYRYYCERHRATGMRGAVQVVDGGSNSS